MAEDWSNSDLAQAELCPVCCDSMAGTTTQDLTALEVVTKCCWQPVCAACRLTVNCGDSVDFLDFVDFVCGHCQANTTIMTNYSHQAVQYCLTKLQSRHYSADSAIKNNFKRIQLRRRQIQRLTEQLDTNLAAILAEPGSEWQLAALTSAIATYRHSQLKQNQIYQADCDMLQRQTTAAARYLAKLHQVIAKVADQAVGQDQTLLQLDYQLNLFHDQLPEIVDLPEYQAVRWFNNRLVLDDVLAQFTSLVTATPKHRLIYPGLSHHFEKILEIGEINKVTLLQSSPSEPVLAVFYCRNGYGLVDQNNRIIEWSRNKLLAVNDNWLVQALVQDSQKHLAIYRLSDVLTLSEEIRPVITISPLQARWDCVFEVELYRDRGPDQANTDHVIVIYEHSRDRLNNNGYSSTTRLQRWTLTGSESGSWTAELTASQDLNNLIILSDYHNDRALLWTVAGNGRHYGSLGLHSANWPDLNATIATLKPLGLLDYKLFSDGSLLGIFQDQDHNIVLYRVGSEIRLSQIELVNFNELDTTSWDGRLFKFSTETGQQYTDVTIDFY